MTEPVPAHSHTADSDTASGEVADTCRPVELPDGNTIRVLGSGDMSPEAVEALGAVVEAAKRRMESEPPDRRRVAIDAVTEALKDVSPPVSLLLRVRAANAVIRALDAAAELARLGQEIGAAPPPAFHWGDGVSSDAIATGREIGIPVCDDDGRELGDMRMGYAKAAVLGASLVDAARSGNPIHVWIKKHAGDLPEWQLRWLDQLAGMQARGQRRAAYEASAAYQRALAVAAGDDPEPEPDIDAFRVALTRGERWPLDRLTDPMVEVLYAELDHFRARGNPETWDRQATVIAKVAAMAARWQYTPGRKDVARELLAALDDAPASELTCGDCGHPVTHTNYRCGTTGCPNGSVDLTITAPATTSDDSTETT